MAKKERKLSQKELERKARFDAVCEEMAQKGYRKQDLTVGVAAANVGALVVMLPFLALAAWAYYRVNSGVISAFSPFVLPAACLLFLLLIVVHEAVHGITWGIFARNHFRSIDFGVIWQALTPYCTCADPLKKGQYVLGSVMPTLLLGFVPAAVSVAMGSPLLFAVSELMILGGGGDFLIIGKILLHRTGGADAVYYDHPYECGVVVFEKDR